MLNHPYNKLKPLLEKALKHKIKSGLIFILLLSGTIYLFFGRTSTENRYTLTTTKYATITSTISGSGQVTSNDQIDIKSKASGDVIYIGALEGQEVRAGYFIAQLNTRNAQKTVRDAEINLENAKLQLEKLRGAETLVIPRNQLKAEENLLKSYEDGFNTVSNVFLDIPAIISSLHDIIYNQDFSKNEWNTDYLANAIKNYTEDAAQFKKDVYIKYEAARTNYDTNFTNYKINNRSSDQITTKKLINETYNTTKNLAESIKSANNLIQLYKDKLKEKNIEPKTIADTFLANLNTYTGKTNSHLINLLNIKNATSANEEALANASLDIRSQELAVKQRENALADAKDTLSDYFIRTPLAGTIAKINIKKLDSINNGLVVATLITKQKNLELSLNEIDIAQIKVGQNATISFDAIPDFKLNGTITRVDTLGTVSQGVVTYNIKINFNSNDDRIKSGMSATALITTNSKENVLTVPNSAVKSQNDKYYVEIFNKKSKTATPTKKFIEIGISNDALTEIISGLNEGDEVIARTILATAKTGTPQAPSLFGGNTSRGTGTSGNTFKIPR